MIIRNAALAALFAFPALTQAEIAAPPAIGENPEPIASSMQEFAAPPAKAKTLSERVDSSDLPSPIPFDSLETELEEDLGLSRDRVGEAASVKSMEIEIQQALEMNDPALAENFSPS